MLAELSWQAFFFLLFFDEAGREGLFFNRYEAETVIKR